MMYGRGFYLNNGCLGFGAFPYWHFFAVGVILVSVVLLIIWIRKNKNIHNNDEAINILREKFVKGEINEEDYLNKKNVLTKK